MKTSQQIAKLSHREFAHLVSNHEYIVCLYSKYMAYSTCILYDPQNNLNHLYYCLIVLFLSSSLFLIVLAALFPLDKSTDPRAERQ